MVTHESTIVNESMCIVQSGTFVLKNKMDNWEHIFMENEVMEKVAHLMSWQHLSSNAPNN